MKLPRTSPCVFSACTAYSEQDGWYLHVVGNSAPKVTRYAQTRPMPRYAGALRTVLHAAAFVCSSTSSTRSASHSKPFA